MDSKSSFFDFAIALLVVSAVLPGSLGKSDTIRVCVSANPSQKTSHAIKHCEQLARSKKTHATCVFATDRLDCFRMVSERKADLTVLEAEDLIFIAGTCTSPCSVQVVSEVRDVKNNAYDYQAVVVIRADTRIDSELRRVKLCHPGWAHLDGRSSLYAQYLEDRLAPQSCNANVTLLEDRIATSAAYFGPSCKAGAWSSDKEEDSRLKATYPSLCALCDDPISCSTSDKYWGEGGAATCLNDGLGDALWFSYANTRIYFKESLTSDERPKYRFLCIDGTTQALNVSEPCIWLARPWPVVVANSKVAIDVQKALDLLNDDSKNEWEDSLMSVFEAYKKNIVNLEISKPPDDYLDSIPGYIGGNEMTLPNCKPKHQVEWCTASSVERSKCTWIAKAARSFAVAPLIACRQLQTLERCLKSVSQGETHIVVVPPDFQPQAYLQYDLQPIFYEQNKGSDLGYSLTALTKQKSNILKLSDLQSKRACFTQHEGLGWRAVVVALRSAGLISSSCTAVKELQNFFSEVCVTAGEGEIPLCCGKRNDENPDAEAFRCLANDGCDVAFISNHTLYRNTDGNNSSPWADGLRSKDFRSVCSKDNTGDCSWARSAPSAIMAAAGLSKVRLQEARQIITELSRLFIRHNKSKSLVLNVFGPFQEEKNVLFQDSSSNLTPAERYTEPPSESNSLEEIISATKYCNTTSKMFTGANLQIIILFLLGKLLW